ncbi:MAG: hypothetical protein V4640_12555 [Verrucomicrobiota bacterium]
MRPPAYLTAAILAMALCIGWLNHRRLEEAQEDLARFAHEVDQREGITSRQLAGLDRNQKRPRPNSLETIKSLVHDCLNFQAGIKPTGMKGESPEEALFYFGYHLQEMVKPLDAEALKMFMAQILEEAEISDAIRQEAITAAFYCLATKSPQTTLDMIGSVASLFKGDRRVYEMVGKPISELADTDPMAALEWILKNSGGPVEFNREQMSHILIRRVARYDPKLAFQIFDKVGFEDIQGGLGAMTENLRTTDQKVALVIAAREYSAVASDDPDRKNVTQAIIRGIAGTYAYGSFNTAREWYESSELSTDEFSDMLRSIGYSHLVSRETGQWLEYLQQKLPAGEATILTRHWMDQWTLDDYEAAGKWLATAAEGPMKNIATKAYAQRIYKYQPETAMQWILMMPPCEQRDSALNEIYLNWPKTDAAGKDAFAKKHGIPE